VRNALQAMVRDAATCATSRSEEYRRKHGPRRDSGRDKPNALKHCLWACIGMKNCKWACASGIVNAWGIRPIFFGGEQGYVDSGMDLINDDEGLECGRRHNSNCLDCCTEKLQKGNPIWF